MRNARSIYRLIFCSILTAFLLLASVPGLYAGAPMAKFQAPGFYRMMVGQIEVTALNDGFTELSANFLGNAPAEEIRNLLDRRFLSGPKIKTSLNAYLINTGTKLILVDSGMGKAAGPSLGFIMQNLKAAGYDPAQVDAVLITHMHRDHIGGLLTPAGKPAFENADIYVARAESAFWTSKEVADKMPQAYQPFFKAARDIATPLIAAGKWKTFEPGDKLPFEGIKPVAIIGHTPGHIAYEVASSGQTLLIWGDVVHNAAIQFTNPNIFLTFDSDKNQAVAIRKALFQRVAGGNVLVAGMHMPFPGIGRVRADGENTYTYVPVDLLPIQ